MDDLTAEGAGVVRCTGLVVFTPGAVPGDVVQVRVARLRRGWADGELLRIIEPAASRRAPACPHQPVCGGCPLMVLDEGAALDLKVRHLREVLRRVGRVDVPVDRVYSAPDALAYRGRVRFAVAPRERAPAFGFHPRGRGDAVAVIDECRLAPPRASLLARDFLERLHRLTAMSCPVWPTQLSVRGSLAAGKWLLVPHTGPGAWPEGVAAAREMAAAHGDVAGVVRLVEQPPAAPFEESILGADAVLERIGDAEFELGATTFLQVNPAAAALLYGAVREALAGPPDCRRLLDLYCGAGLVGLLCVGDDVDVLGVELHPATVEQARRAAARAGRRNLEFRVGDALHTALALVATHEKFDRVCLNPPRAGAAEGLTDTLHALGARIVAMISCHPAALARDVARFRQAGYEPRWLAAVDMFPQTPHLEVVVRLEAAP